MPFRGDDPFGELEELFDRMSREFGGGAFAGAGSIAVDVEDRDDDVVVTADLPGYSKDDIDVTLADRTLRIAAESATEEVEDDADFLRRERRRTSVERSVRLPAAVEEEDVSATYKNGVLAVTLPKRAEEGQQIDVE